MEFNILKKRFDIGRKFDDFLDKVSESGILFKHGVDAYLKGNIDSFEKKIEDITAVEHHGDALRRDLEEQLYTQTLIPESRGDVLELLPAMPPEWLTPDCPLRLEKTPTRFGPVSLSLHVDASGEGVIEIGLTPDWPLSPDHCVLYVPQAAQTKIDQVLVNGQPMAVSAEGTVELPITNKVNVTGTLVN